MLELLFMYFSLLGIFLLFVLFFWRQEDEIDIIELKRLKDAWYESVSDMLELFQDVDFQYEYYWLRKEGKLR